MTNLTVISHFYNEELLLPYWLKHNREIFDHGIMIDYASTDNSRDIIHCLCPTWEIVDSRNTEFDALDIDKEVMEIEETVQGWKTVLNTTEFVVFDKDFLVNSNKKGFNIETVYNMVDVEPGVLDDRPLLQQKRFGYLDTDDNGRHRLIHSWPRGKYGVGRHIYSIAAVVLPGSALYHFGYCPWPQVLPRKIQIGPRLSQSDVTERLGYYHLYDEKKHTEVYEEMLPLATKIV